MLLEYSGLVESAAHRGTFVSKMSVEIFDELMEMRTTLARTFVRRFVEMHSREDQEVLERYFEQMADLVANDEQELQFAEVSDRCLLFIAMRAGNSRIARAMSSLSLQLLRYFAVAARTVIQRRLRLSRWQEAGRIMAARNADQALALFDQMVQVYDVDIRASIRDAA